MKLNNTVDLYYYLSLIFKLKNNLMKQLHIFSNLFLIFALALSSSCKKDPYVPDYDHAGGYVIAKEACSATDPNNDYWLVDLSVNYTASNTFGDTMTYNGTFYEHMIKTKGLLPQFKVIGKKLSFDCHFSSTKVATTGCTIAAPVTYFLKEMQVINSGEIR